MVENKKFDVKLVVFIGFAFFTSELAWSIYNARVSIFLGPEGIGFALGIVGIWMALDNMIGVVIQPIMGTLSDNTRSRFGRRMPYILIGVPLSAIFFVIIPYFSENFVGLIFWMFLFGLAMGLYRSQAVSLMPDFVKPEDRSKGNAVINAMAGVGGVIGFGIFSLESLITEQGIFIIGAVIMIIGLVIVFVKVDETKSFSYIALTQIEEKEGIKIKEKKDKPNLKESLIDIVKEKDKSTLIMLFAIFSWFIAYQGLAALLSNYGMIVLNQSESFSSFLGFFVALPIIIFAFPFAKIAGKIGRRNAIKIGLIIMITCLVLGFFIGYLRENGLILMIFVLVFAGIGWSFINVNSIVIIWELAPSQEKIGTYTGVYYLFAFMAAILGPFFLGVLTDVTSPPNLPYTLLLNGAIFFIISLVLMFFVKRGEVEDLTEQQKINRQKAIQNL